MNPRPSRISRGRSLVTGLLACWLSIALLFSGCTTLAHVPSPQPGGPPPAVRVGDEVEAHLKDGRLVAFTIIALESDALVGARQRVAFDQIFELRVRRTSPGRTAAFTGLMIASALLVLVVVAAATGHIAIMPSGPS